MMELVDLYDENRIPLGRTAERHAPKGPGEYRLVVHVCAFDRRGRLLIQQRARSKFIFPNLWDVSVGGGVDAGETSRQAAEHGWVLVQDTSWEGYEQIPMWIMEGYTTLALEAAEQGIDKIRINPGNIGAPERVEAVAKACRERHIPIRVGVNGGSLEKELLAKYGGPTPEAMVESALGHIRLLELYGFENICVSLKASSVPATMGAYRLMAERYDYPLHLGVTEAGTRDIGELKAAAGIGGLLGLGIGDTLRVSLTADPVEEIYAARRILKAIGLRREGPELISCPTCGRTQIDLIPMAKRVEELLNGREV